MKRLATALAFTATSPSRFYRNANTSIQNHRSDIPLVISNVISPKNFSSDSNGTRPLVVCGPSGVGKGTLIDLLMKRFPPIESRDQIGFSVSHTTRQPREGEVDGQHYHFTTIDQIQNDISGDKFLEYAEVHGNYYGTSIDSVNAVQRKGMVCILDIDAQGVRSIKERDDVVNPHYIFIAPPSLDLLETRLRDRGTETEESIQKRLGNASTEIEYGTSEGTFDYILVNNDLEAALEELVEDVKKAYPTLVEVK